ncbi:MAG: hypothetical protein JWP89_891 [Schlesneria sp.]|nr:hypothetical protein [Schlesneria sp.]
MMRQVRPQFDRRGFTLVEVLVVIGLIAFLLSITIGTLRNAIGIARQRQTEATILKIHGLLQQRVEAFDRATDKLNLNAPKQKLVTDFNQNYGASYYLDYTNDSRLIDALTRKQLFQSRFPQTFAERNISASSTLPPASPHNAKTQSSALLYWILTSSEIFGVSPVDDSEFSATEVQDTDGDGLKEFVDGWGRPLRFYRWPTMLFRPGNGTIQSGALVPGNPTTWDNTRSYANAIWSGLPSIASNGFDPLIIDPDDPAAQMYLASTKDSTGKVLPLLQYLFSTPSTYHAFLVVSAGPDGILGLGEPYDYDGSNDPNQTPPLTATRPTFGIPAVTPPALGTAQGRLAAPDPTYASASIQNHPINDNLSNRKR